MQLRRWWWVFAFFAWASCGKSGDAACVTREQLDDKSIYSCVEAEGLNSDEYSETEAWCESLPGRENYAESTFKSELCPRDNIVGGCAFSATRRIWYYPNDDGKPTAADMDALCVGYRAQQLPPP
jgi:hypothetical protein